MNRRFTHLSVTIGLLAAVALTVTACAHPRPCPTGPVASGLAIAVGDRANSPSPSWPTQLDPQLTKIIKATGQGPAQPGIAAVGATFVQVDGDPTIGCVMTYDASGANGPARSSNRQAFTAGVQQEVTRLKAADAQADPLTALSRASGAAGPGGTVVLIDSGLQTVPPLDFATEDLLDADISSVVAQLAAERELPHLRGQTVILDGIGYTARPQAPLDESQRDDLIELWQQIARAAGATHVRTITTPNTSAAGHGMLPVSTVPVPAPGNVSLGCNRRTDLPDDGAVGFLPNRTTFRDASAARAVLARIADWLRRNPEADADLTGSIAHYGADDSGGLSEARAGRIRSVLIELGAGPGHVTAAGVGWGPFPTPTAAPDPVSDPLNRRVVVELTCP